jgi:uncharacterized membrane protein
MTISISNNTVSIMGHIKSLTDYQTIKSQIDALASKNLKIIIEIPESISITSSVIGYFNKLVLKDKRDITMRIGSDQLMELLEDLNLKDLFKASKI